MKKQRHYKFKKGEQIHVDERYQWFPEHILLKKIDDMGLNRDGSHETSELDVATKDFEIIIKY